MSDTSPPSYGQASGCHEIGCCACKWKGLGLLSPLVQMARPCSSSTAPGSSMLACTRSAASLAACACCASRSAAHADAIKPFTTSLGRLMPFQQRLFKASCGAVFSRKQRLRGCMQASRCTCIQPDILVHWQ